MEDELLSFTVKIHNKNKVFYLSCQGIFKNNTKTAATILYNTELFCSKLQINLLKLQKL